MSLIIAKAQDHPLFLTLAADFIRSHSVQEIQNLLQNGLYDIQENSGKPSSQIIEAVKPEIITSTNHILQELKKVPQDIYQVAPRQFEEIIAELMTDKGWEVTLTPATRDGGKDILAFFNTGIGRFLCLIEAKRYAKERVIGVNIVRSLFGTLCDHQANSAMLVTTSYFSPDARDFQKRHQYQLALKDYSDVADWILKYKKSS